MDLKDSFRLGHCAKKPVFIEYEFLAIGENTLIDEGVWLCYPCKDGSVNKVTIGNNCRIRSGTVIYSGVQIGDNVQTGHHVVIRENCTIGNNSSIGTGVKIENNTIIGHHTSIETQSHITAYATIGDYNFFGAMVITNNDFKMSYRRVDQGKFLKGCKTGKGVRVGSGAMLMAGVEIGDHSVINAGEVVRKNVPANVMMFTRKSGIVYKAIKPDLIEEK